MPLALRAHRLLWYGTILLGGMMLVAWPTLASLDTVAGLFATGDYQGARDALAAGGQGARPGEDLLWASRLATDPAAALSLLKSTADNQHFTETVRLRATLEAAEIESGRGNDNAVLALLRPLLAGDPSTLPSAVYLRAGLSLRALGQLQQAREMLASVRPDDPQFVLARYYLGDIGLEQNDVTLAQRYFSAAEKAATAAQRSRLAAGTWQTLRATGADDQAAELASRLAKTDPGSLALLEIRRLLQVETDERSARSEVAAGDATVTAPRELAGRYSLQIGAFSDRGLALEFVKRFHDRLPDLRIDKSRDDRGQFLYKVRLGEYVNPALARAEARKLEDRLHIDVIAVELAPTTGSAPDQ